MAYVSSLPNNCTDDEVKAFFHPIVRSGLRRVTMQGNQHRDAAPHGHNQAVLLEFNDLADLDELMRRKDLCFRAGQKPMKIQRQRDPRALAMSQPQRILIMPPEALGGPFGALHTSGPPPCLPSPPLPLMHNNQPIYAPQPALPLMNPDRYAAGPYQHAVHHPGQQYQQPPLSPYPTITTAQVPAPQQPAPQGTFVIPPGGQYLSNTQVMYYTQPQGGTYPQYPQAAAANSFLNFPQFPPPQTATLPPTQGLAPQYPPSHFGPPVVRTFATALPQPPAPVGSDALHR
jgi:hypothetical protein